VGVTPTLINVYYGENGAAAKVNIHADDQYKVDERQFWPSEIVVRPWVSKEEWEKQRPRLGRQPRRRYHKRWGNDYTERRDYDRLDGGAPRYGSRHHRHDSHTGRWDKRYHGYDTYSHRYDDDYDRDDQDRDDNEGGHGFVYIPSFPFSVYIG